MVKGQSAVSKKAPAATSVVEAKEGKKSSKKMVMKLTFALAKAPASRGADAVDCDATDLDTAHTLEGKNNTVHGIMLVSIGKG
jgi:phosphoribosylformimino-5-aminoimidazole carboxamide ribonucleotide (ProFAR) isomerase